MSNFSAEEEIYSRLDEIKSKKLPLNSITEVQSEEFVLNNRGQKLHIRSYWPDEVSQTKAVVFYNHGYDAHINRPPFKYFGKYFNQSNISFITFDYHGHGYSEGMRAYIEHENDLIDDALCVILTFFGYSPADNDEHKNYFIKNSFSKDSTNKIPFFFMGLSLGGGLSLVLSHIFSLLSTSEIPTTSLFTHFAINQYLELKKVLTYHPFSGCLLLAPLVSIHPPPYFLKFMLENIFLPIFPSNSVPQFSAIDFSKGFVSPIYIEYVQSDNLTYGYPVRLRTAKTMLDFADKILNETIVSSTYPFILFHDPEDLVVSYELGGKRLFEESPSQNKVYVELKGGRHDLSMNTLSIVAEKSIEFIKKIIEK
eukprot:gene6663-9145_t